MYSGKPDFSPLTTAVTVVGGFFCWHIKMLTADRARELLTYDPKTGWLTWKVSRGSSKKGSRAGNVNKKPQGFRYRKVTVDGISFLEHRVIWLMVTGRWPEEEIDHENHITMDNSWKNLKEATKVENGRNQPQRSTNTSGHTGVTWNKRRNKFQAYIRTENIRYHLGYFSDIESAVLAREEAELRFGFHVNHGRKPQ